VRFKIGDKIIGIENCGYPMANTDAIYKVMGKTIEINDEYWMPVKLLRHKDRNRKDNIGKVFNVLWRYFNKVDENENRIIE